LLSLGLAVFWSNLVPAQVLKAWESYGVFGGDAYVDALAVDSAGNAYVTGDAWISGDVYYMTAKYDPDGKLQWLSRYTGPGYLDVPNGIAVDNTGNVYVTGYSFGTNTGYDFATVKYDPDGNQLWAVRYNGPANTNDFGRRVALDSAGNVYVTGDSAGSNSSAVVTVKYDGSGTQLWVARFEDAENPRGIAVDSAGNVYFTASGVESIGHGYVTVKYNTDGKQLWASRYGSGSATAFALDSAGNVYVTGYSSGFGFEDYETVKYDPQGNRLWTALYSSPGDFPDNADRARSVVVDVAGNVYVTGESQGQRGLTGYATVKYDAEGNRLWVTRFDDESDFPNSAGGVSLAVDGTGNSYVAGYAFGDLLVFKYNRDGKQIWATGYGQGRLFCGPTALALDGAENVLVTGGCGGQFGFSTDITVKYVQTPRLIAPAWQSTGQFGFRLIGEAGRSYTVQASTKLVNWTSVTNFVSATGTNQFTDSAATNIKRRFYRAVTP